MSHCHGLRQSRPTSEELGTVTAPHGGSAVRPWPVSALAAWGERHPQEQPGTTQHARGRQLHSRPHRPVGQDPAHHVPPRVTGRGKATTLSGLKDTQHNPAQKASRNNTQSHDGNYPHERPRHRTRDKPVPRWPRLERGSTQQAGSAPLPSAGRRAPGRWALGTGPPGLTGSSAPRPAMKPPGSLGRAL